MSFSAIFNREIDGHLEGDARFFVDWSGLQVVSPPFKNSEVEVPRLLQCLQTRCLGPQGSVGQLLVPALLPSTYHKSNNWDSYLIFGNPWDVVFFGAGHHPPRPLDAAAERSGKGNDCRWALFISCRCHSLSIRGRHPKGLCFCFAALFHHSGTKFWIIPVKVNVECDCDFRVIDNYCNWSWNCSSLLFFCLRLCRSAKFLTNWSPHDWLLYNFHPIPTSVEVPSMKVWRLVDLVTWILHWTMAQQ